MPKAGNWRKIGEVAELLGTTPRTLRFYEEEGLIASRRTPGGTRLYSEGDIARFRAILRLTGQGIPLAVIKRLATARAESATGAESSRKVSDLLDALLGAIRDQKDKLDRMERDLEQTAALVNQCSSCRNPPTRTGCPSCPVNRNLDLSELLHLVWEQDHA